jgi:hypothetical protein
MNHKFSHQAVGAIMMALQQSLLEMTDIVPVIEGFDVQIDDTGKLVIMNPPVVKITNTKNSGEDEEIQTSVQ